MFDDQIALFESLLVSLQQRREFIDTDTLLALQTGRKPIDRRYLHLSFDDGFRNNFTNAYPVLKRLGIPAIFFVPSKLIGADWDMARDYAINTTHHAAPIELMNWEDLRALRDAGFEIGSHTRTHARFSSISGDRSKLESEIIGSKQDLEAALGIPCKYISWPYGTDRDADELSLACTREAGYSACFSATRGSVRPGMTDAFRIPRHHFEPNWPISHVEFFARGNWEKHP